MLHFERVKIDLIKANILYKGIKSHEAILVMLFFLILSIL